MRCVTFQSDMKKAWDEYVQGHPHAWVGHISGMFEFASAHNKAKNYSQVVLDDRERIIGILPLFLSERRSHLLFKIRRLHSGSQLRSGPLIKLELHMSKTYENILYLLTEQVRKLAGSLSVDEVIIPYQCIVGDRTSIDYYGYLPLRSYGYQNTDVTAMILDLSMDESELFANLTSNCRKMIRRAIKEDAEVRPFTNRDHWLGCYDLNCGTLQKGAYSMQTMEVIWDEFIAPGYAHALGIYHQQNISNVIVTALLGSAGYYWIGLNARPVFLKGGANLAMWESIKHCKRMGCRYFEIGSKEFSDSKAIAISKFKEQFNGRPVSTLLGKLYPKPVKHALRQLLGALKSGHRN